MVGEEAAEQRPPHAGQREHGAEVALVATALPGAHDVADDGHRPRQQPPGANSLLGQARQGGQLP